MNRNYPNTVFNTAASHHNEGIKLASEGRLTEAIEHIEAAVQLCPDNPVWQFNLGLAWQQLKNLPKALEAYRTATALAPDFFDAWNNFSAALKSSGEILPAVEAAEKAIRLKPESSAAHLNLGNAVKALGRYDQAEKAYSQAMALAPNDPRAQVNLANTVRESGRLDEAIELLRDVVSKHSRFPEAHRDLAFALLLSGQLLEGWDENEWRWGTQDLVKSRRNFHQPTWAGEDLCGQTLMIHAEQGFGDSIQFIRFIELVNQTGAQIVFECQPALKRLFQSFNGIDLLIAKGDPLPNFDYQIPLLSLPRIFRTTLETIPNQVPYLKAPLDWIPLAHSLHNRDLNVGLVWAGNPDHRNDLARSMSLDLLRPILGIPGIRFYSLQVGQRAVDLRQSPEFGRIVDLSPSLADFASTAAAVSKLDLMICVDTAVAHLAGALAKPIWLLLPAASDWRWLAGREDSPWYPTMRLFRQPRPNDWRSVVQALKTRLEGMITQKSTTQEAGSL